MSYSVYVIPATVRVADQAELLRCYLNAMKDRGSSLVTVLSSNGTYTVIHEEPTHAKEKTQRLSKK